MCQDRAGRLVGKVQACCFAPAGSPAWARCLHASQFVEMQLGPSCHAPRRVGAFPLHKHARSDGVPRSPGRIKKACGGRASCAVRAGKAGAHGIQSSSYARDPFGAPCAASLGCKRGAHAGGQPRAVARNEGRSFAAGAPWRLLARGSAAHTHSGRPARSGPGVAVDPVQASDGPVKAGAWVQPCPTAFWSPWRRSTVGRAGAFRRDRSASGTACRR